MNAGSVRGLCLILSYATRPDFLYDYAEINLLFPCSAPCLNPARGAVSRRIPGTDNTRYQNCCIFHGFLEVRASVYELARYLLD